MYVCMDVWMYTYIYIYINVHIYMDTCICVYDMHTIKGLTWQWTAYIYKYLYVYVHQDRYCIGVCSRLDNGHEAEVYHAATRCNTVSHCTTLQHTAPHCTTLHHTAPHCTTLQHLTVCQKRRAQHTATHYNTLQHTATTCNTDYKTWQWSKSGGPSEMMTYPLASMSPAFCIFFLWTQCHPHSAYMSHRVSTSHVSFEHVM